MEEDKLRIKSPEGVQKLMEELWQRHKSGEAKPRNNIFWVDLPAPTEEELEASRKFMEDADKQSQE
ncbi:MAG: hypothetical protein J1F07_06460 [Muribaculaceae bacterium]|nr:hypothetical protein [Muribaculaceae bacterium]